MSWNRVGGSRGEEGRQPLQSQPDPEPPLPPAASNPPLPLLQQVLSLPQAGDWSTAPASAVAAPARPQSWRSWGTEATGGEVGVRGTMVAEGDKLQGGRWWKWQAPGDKLVHPLHMLPTATATTWLPTACFPLLSTLPAPYHHLPPTTFPIACPFTASPT